MILEQLQPTWDGRRIESRFISAPMNVAYRAVVETDFLDAVRSSWAVRALFAIRAGIERLAVAFLRRLVATMPEPETMKLADMPRHGTWVKLGEAAPNEIAFGAIGRFWTGETVWREIDGSDFAQFSLAGYAKIGCHILLEPMDGGTRITYEARTTATDKASRRGFLLYWCLVSPMVGVVMRSTLSVISRNAVRINQDAWCREACV